MQMVPPQRANSSTSNTLEPATESRKLCKYDEYTLSPQQGSERLSIMHATLIGNVTVGVVADEVREAVVLAAVDVVVLVLGIVHESAQRSF